MIPLVLPTPIMVEAPADASPIRALVETRTGGIHVRLIGASQTPVDARYTLTLVAGTNHTKQGGNAHLVSLPR